VSERAQAWADRYERENAAIIDAIGRLSDAEWSATCSGETWSVGVTARHIATGHAMMLSVLEPLAAGTSLPATTFEDIHTANARDAIEHAQVTREEVIELLRANGEAAVRAIRELTDEQLDREQPLPAFGGAPISAARWIEPISLGHMNGHFASIQAALATARTEV
jgi:uncharacterized damage-inducible protein DinB